MELVVKLAAAECYAIHNNLNEWNFGEREQLLQDIGTNRTAFRLAGPAARYLPMEEAVFDRLRDRAETVDNIRNFVDNIDFSRLEEMDRSCDHATFMEVLLNAIKNDTISYQFFVHKIKKENVEGLIMELTQVKSSPDPCTETINRLETRLNIHWEEEMTREMETYSLFEYVNMEKMTPHFLKLAKNTQPDSKLLDITRDDNSAFDSEAELKEYIVKYYENLYKLPVIQRNEFRGSIEGFLGPDILASPLVNNMKIS